MNDFPTTLDVFAETNESFSVVIVDGDNEPLNLTDQTVFNTANFKIVEGDYTPIATAPVSYTERDIGLVEILIEDDITTNENAGNWIGLINLLTNEGKTTLTQTVNFNILKTKNTS